MIILTSVPEGELGEAIARRLIEERLAACVNLYGPMSSFYRWRGAVECEVERQVVIKTTRTRVPAVQACLAGLHPYELPEFIVLSVADGSTAYLAWLESESVAP